MSIVQQSPTPSSASSQQPTRKYPNVLAKNCESWYLDSSTADIHFTFDSANHCTPSSQRIGAHKLILAIDSDAFKAMFFGDLKESGDIHVADASSAAFKEFLQFFYLNEVELSFGHIAEVLHLGHKYLIPKCIDVCIRFLRDSVTANNSLSILSLATVYDHTELMKLCKRFIMLNTSAVINSSDFLECDRHILGDIFNLFVCSEIELFEATMAWVKAKSGHDVLSREIVDEYLGNLFYEFRFRTMTIQKFCSLAKKYEAVLSNDYKAITELIVLPQSQHHQFNTRPREIKWNENGAITVCSGGTSATANIIKAASFEAIELSTNKPLLLTGFQCSRLKSFSSFPEDNEPYCSNAENVSSGALVHVKIREEAAQPDVRNSKDLLKTNARLGYSDANILLPRPILVKPGHRYQISIRYPYSYAYYSNAIKRTMQLPFDTTIEFHDGRTSDDNGNFIGLFSSFKFIRV